MARTTGATGDKYLTTSTPPVTAAPFTVSAWAFQATDPADDDCIVQVQDNSVSDNYWRMGRWDPAFGGLDVMLFRAQAGGTSASAQTGNDLLVGTWNHCVGVEVSSSSRKAVLNGDLGNAGTNTDTVTPSGINSCDVGREGDSSPADHWEGELAEVAFWNVALTDNEIVALSRGVSPLRIRPASLLAYWPIYGLASPEPDLSGNVNNLTLNGSPALANHAPVIPYSSRFWTPGQLIESGETVTPATLGLVWSQPIPTVSFGGISVTPTTQGLVWSQPIPSVSFGGVTFTPATQSLVWSQPNPTTTLGTLTVTPGTLGMVWSQGGPTVSFGGVTVTPNTQGLVWSLPTPTSSLGTVVTPATLQLVWSQLAPTLTFGGITATPLTQGMVWTPNAPTPSFGGISVTPGQVLPVVWSIVAPTSVGESTTIQGFAMATLSLNPDGSGVLTMDVEGIGTVSLPVSGSGLLDLVR